MVVLSIKLVWKAFCFCFSAEVCLSQRSAAKFMNASLPQPKNQRLRMKLLRLQLSCDFAGNGSALLVCAMRWSVQELLKNNMHLTSSSNSPKPFASTQGIETRVYVYIHTDLHVHMSERDELTCVHKQMYMYVKCVYMEDVHRCI